MLQWPPSAPPCSGQVRDSPLYVASHGLAGSNGCGSSAEKVALPQASALTYHRGQGRFYIRLIPNNARGISQEQAAPALLFGLGRPSVNRRHFRPAGKAVGSRHPKTDVVVTIIWVVPVAVSAAGVVLIVVPRAATQHPAPSGLSLQPRRDIPPELPIFYLYYIKPTLPLRPPNQKSEIQKPETNPVKESQGKPPPENR